MDKQEELNNKLLEFAGIPKDLAYFLKPKFPRSFDDCVTWLIPLLRPICEWELSPCKEGYLFSLFTAFNPDKPVIDIKRRGETLPVVVAEVIGELIDVLKDFEEVKKNER